MEKPNPYKWEPKAARTPDLRPLDFAKLARSLSPVDRPRDPGAPPACVACRDTGFVEVPSADDDPFMPRMANCLECNTPEHAQIRRVLDASKLDVQAPNPPSLENFEPHDDASERMLAAAVDFVNHPAGWLVYHGQGRGRQDRAAGNWGAGKSHLGEAITRALLAARVPTLFMTMDRLMVYLGAGWRNDSDETDYDRRFEWIVNLPVLVIDELNKESPSPSTDRMRHLLLDSRYIKAIREEGGATVLISNDHPDAWADPAIADRAQDTRFVQVQVTPVSYRRVKR